MSVVLVAHILCTTTGAPPPTWTLPIRTARVGILSMQAYSSRSSSSLNLTEGVRGCNCPRRKTCSSASLAFARSVLADGVAHSFADETGSPQSSVELFPHLSPPPRVCARLHPESVHRRFSSQHHPLSFWYGTDKRKSRLDQ